MNIKVERSITINLLLYYLHVYVNINYYHVPFYFIKSINSKNKKRKSAIYNFLFEMILRNKKNIKSVLCNF